MERHHHDSTDSGWQRFVDLMCFVFLLAVIATPFVVGVVLRGGGD